MSTDIEKTGLEWAKEHNVVILDPDGFGERTKGMPLTTDFMTESDFIRGVGLSTCKLPGCNNLPNRQHPIGKPR